MKLKFMFMFVMFVVFHSLTTLVVSKKAAKPKIMWLSGNDGDRNLNILDAHGRSQAKSFSISIDSTLKRFTATTVDFTTQRIFFVDAYTSNNLLAQARITSMTSSSLTSQQYQLSYDGRIDSFIGIQTQSSSVLYPGVDDITDDIIGSMAYDAITGNIYWPANDAIMVADTKLDYYATIYQSSEEILALALHSEKKQLFFVTNPIYRYEYHRKCGTKIMTSDLAGKNARELFVHPDANGVSGIAVDDVQEKIYWTDKVNETASRVMSSNLDGTNRAKIYEKSGADFSGIVVYMGYVYVSDFTKRENQGGFPYTIWILTLTENNLVGSVASYNTKHKPLSLAAYVDHKKIPERSSDLLGLCSSAPLCDRFCLPRVNARRDCVCSKTLISPQCYSHSFDDNSTVPPIHDSELQDIESILEEMSTPSLYAPKDDIDNWLYNDMTAVPSIYDRNDDYDSSLNSQYDDLFDNPPSYKISSQVSGYVSYSAGISTGGIVGIIAVVVIVKISLISLRIWYCRRRRVTVVHVDRVALIG